MGISLSPETQKLIEDRMKEAGISTADELVRAALEALGELTPDEETWRAIDRAESQYQRGEGIPLDEAMAQLRKKHFNC